MKTIGELRKGDIIYHYYGGLLHPFKIDSITISTVSKLITIKGSYVDASFYDNSGFEINSSFLNKSSSMSISTHNDKEGVEEIKTNREANIMYLENSKKRKLEKLL